MMRLSIFYIILVVGARSTTIQQNELDNKPAVMVTSGIEFQVLPNITFYEYSVPVLFLASQCWVYQPVAQYCNVNTNTSNFCDWLTSKFENIQDGHPSLFRSDDNPLRGDGSIFATPFVLADKQHIENVFISDSTMQQIVQKAKKYKHFVNIFNTSFCDRHITRKDAATLSTSGAGPLFELVLQAYRTELVYRTCMTRHLSPRIISPSFLSNTLDSVLGNNTGYRLVWPKENIGKYYSAPIADCLMSKQSIMIGIQIPLISADIQQSLGRLFSPTPFAFYDKTCMINLNEQALALLYSPGNLRIFLPRCDVYKSVLCLITPAFGLSALLSACAHAVLQGTSASNLSKVCPMHCINNNKPIVTQLDPFTFILTHVHTLEVQCPNFNRTVTLSDEIGAFQIMIPCKCSAKAEHYQLYPPRQCMEYSHSPIHFKQLIPAPWSSTETIILPAYNEKNYPIYTSLAQCYNYKWYSTAKPNLILWITIGILFTMCTIIVVYLIYLARISGMPSFCWKNPPTWSDSLTVHEPRPSGTSSPSHRYDDIAPKTIPPVIPPAMNNYEPPHIYEPPPINRVVYTNPRPDNQIYILPRELERMPYVNTGTSQV